MCVYGIKKHCRQYSKTYNCELGLKCLQLLSVVIEVQVIKIYFYFVLLHTGSSSRLLKIESFFVCFIVHRFVVTVVKRGEFGALFIIIL